MKKIIAVFLVWRFLLFIPIYFSSIFISYRLGYDYTNIWKFTHSYFPVSSPFLFPWANFDGVHYLSIAANGYSNDQGFFPLFPLLIKFFSIFLGGKKAFDLGYFTSAFLTSNISFVLALIIFYKLILIDFSRKIAWKSIMFLLVFPTSFFFASIYTESLFLLLTLLSFYFARKKKWFLASLFGMFCAATRLVGIVILPALVLEFIRAEKKISAKALSLLIVPLGIISYAFYNWRAGSPFAFIAAHEKINSTRSLSPVFFPQTVFRYLKILVTTPHNYEWGIALLELSSFAFASLMLYIAYKKKVRVSYILFSVLAFIIPVSSGTFSGLPRYILILFPIFLALALTKNKLAQILYLAISVIILTVLLAAFSRGYFVA